MAEDQKSYHFDEVSKHNATKDCWLIIHGKLVCRPNTIGLKPNESKSCHLNGNMGGDSLGDNGHLFFDSVYDVTPFMDEHPGGDEVLLAATGKDATNDFEDVGHSDSARDMIHKYCIGEIDASTVPAKRAYVPPQQAPYNPDKTSDFVIKILQFLVPILILGLAFAIRYYTKAE